MARSTLNPGRPSAAIVKLREAALREMDAEDQNTSAEDPDFEITHDAGNYTHGNKSLVPDYSVSDNPHVGNGRGPIG